MKLIDQSHQILHIDNLERIEIAGRTCYKSEDKINKNSADKFCKMLVKRGHEAMIEHASATVKFITNRGVTHELVRHRVASFGQESTRYVNYSGSDISFIRPVWLYDQENWSHVVFENACEEAECYYNDLLEKGWRPEQAREVLPNALKTEIVVTANFREWCHIFKLRAIGTTGRPHPQMQALMKPVLQEFIMAAPAVFGDLIVN